MNKFDISDIPSEYPFPTRVLVLPILYSLQRSTKNFGWNSDIRNVFQIFQSNLDSFRFMIKVVLVFYFLLAFLKLVFFFYFSLYWASSIIWNPATGSASSFLVRSLCRFEAGRSSEPCRLTGKKIVLRHDLEIKV